MPAISLGTSVYDRLGSLGEHDAFTINLVAGQTYEFRLHGVGFNELADPFLRLYNSSSTLVASNDDFTWGGTELRDSRLVVTATTTGTYTIDVGAFNDLYAGNYLLTAVQANSSGMVFTNDEMAWQLVTNGMNFFGDPAAAFNVGADNTITVNLTGLTAQGQFLAQQALLAWTNVTGITFQHVGGAAEITFDDSDAGTQAYANPSIFGNTITSATVMITTGWLNQFGTTLNSYSFETYIHEIGHALGLGHGGNYNNSATYGVDNYYLNDSLAYSIMSYMQAQNDEFGSPMVNTFVDASFRYILTPQMADIIAIQYLYGDRITHFAGNTTYGFGSNTGNTALDSAVNYGAAAAFTIFDEGGVDTLNFTNYSGSQILNLNSESFSSVLGGRMNLAIARGVTIESANGGTGNDSIFGNAADNILNGRDGADTMWGDLGNDTFYVERPTDVVIENPDSGTDTVVAAYNGYTLGSTLENLTLASWAGSINGRGNDGNNTIIGNSGNNEINGGDGVDVMIGGLGNDTYFANHPLDVLIESSDSGVDTVVPWVSWTLAPTFENLTLNPGSGWISGTGNSGNNVIIGNDSGNFLYGGFGNDTLTGGIGVDPDYFVFDTFLDAGSNVDRITDFNDANDTFVLNRAIFSSLALGYITADQFYIGSQAGDVADRIIYNQSTGQLFYDSDGGGGVVAIPFAMVGPGRSLSYNDFFVT